MKPAAPIIATEAPRSIALRSGLDTPETLSQAPLFAPIDSFHLSVQDSDSLRDVDFWFFVDLSTAI
jgi:hypothetical protein